MSESGSGEPVDSSAANDKDSSVCPTCGQECKSKRGVSVHHAKAHGESISLVEIECHTCGKTVERRKPHLRGEVHFCSTDCCGEYTAKRQQKEFPTLECEWCGETYSRTPAEASQSRFCSKECKYNGQAEEMKGENSPVWKGGTETYYGPNWNEQRQRTLERDNFTCQDCGVDDSECSRSLSVHHIRRLAWFKEEYDEPTWYELANDLDNLVSLCTVCHKKWEGIPLRPDTR